MIRWGKKSRISIKIKPLIAFSFVLTLTIFTYQNCGETFHVKTDVNSKSGEGRVGFDHSNFDLSSCSACHESLRPSPDHGGGGDCVNCHMTNDWSLVSNFDHSSVDTSECATCHEDDRPDADHGGGKDCVACHTPVLWENPVNFTHSPVPNQCVTCHRVERPNTGNRMRRDPNLNNNDSHYGDDKVDCRLCHMAKDVRGTNSYDFDHYQADGTKMQVCLPCHYDRGIREHGNNNPTWFQPPIYDLANGQLGNCYDCHDVRRKSFAE